MNKQATNLKIIKATNISPEKVTDGKYITATSGKCNLDTTTSGSVSETFKDGIYSIDALRTYHSLPKQLQNLTASIAYCHHTNTQITVATGFKNCPELTSFIKHEHSIFSPRLPLLTAIKIYGKSNTPTEQYIAMTAILVKSRIIDTTKQGLLLDSEALNKLRPHVDALVAVINQSLRFEFTMPLDSLLIDSENCSNVSRLKTQIKDATQAIDTATYSAGGQRLVAPDHRSTKQLKLEEEIALEQELNKILSGYNSTTSSRKYTPQLNRWTRRALSRSDMTDDQIAMSMKILNTQPDMLRSGTVEKILPIVETSLSYEDDVSRRNSAIVLRHLHYMIELQQACLYKFGFVSEIVKEEVVLDKAQVKFVTNSKIAEDETFKKIALKTSSAFERLKAKASYKVK